MSGETATDSTSYELAISGDLTDAERAEYWQRAYERMAARNGKLSLTIIRMEEALKPFADVAACYPKADKAYPHPVSNMGVYDKSCPVYIRDYFNAYAALTGEQQP